MDMTKMLRVQELNTALKASGYLSVSWRLVSYPLSQATAEWSGEVRAWGGRDLPNVEIVVEANDIDVVLGGLILGLEERIKGLIARDTTVCADCLKNRGVLRLCKRHLWKGFFL